MVNESIINTASSFLKQIPSEIGVKKAFLFGSYAKGTEKENSDIDIAVVITDRSDFFSIQMLLMRIRRKIDLRIEPHPIMESDFNSLNPFASEIQNHGLQLEF